jgi:hypothetical protein
MKTLILVVMASLATSSTPANAASANDCAKIIKNLKVGASAISQNANSYWQHRAKFASLNYGLGRQAVPNALTVAGEEKSHVNALRAAMPNSLASFDNLVKPVLSKHCLSPAQLSAIVEPVIKHAKRVKLDKLPEGEEHPRESSISREAPRMPNK